MIRIDSDTHFTPIDAFDHVDPKYADAAPRLFELPSGRLRVTYPAREPFVPHQRLIRDQLCPRNSTVKWPWSPAATAASASRPRSDSPRKARRSKYKDLSVISDERISAAFLNSMVHPTKVLTIVDKSRPQKFQFR